MKQHATKSVPMLFGAAALRSIRALTVDGAELLTAGKPKYEQIAKKQLGKRVHIGSHRNFK